MTSSPINAEMAELLEALCLDELSPTDAERLEELVRADENACRHYVTFMHFHALAERFCGADAAHEAKLLEERLAVPADSAPIAAPIAPAPVLGFLGDSWQGTKTYFAEGWPLAYLLATLFIGTGIWISSLIPVSHAVLMARKTSVPPAGTTPLESQLVQVGRITGMADCKWSKDGRAPAGFDAVLLGRQFKLDAGLLEITYDTGARVILQGPATYTAESRDGGFLAVGKLTARLEKKQQSAVSVQPSEETASDRWSVAAGSVATENNLPSPASGRGVGGEGGPQQNTDGNRNQLQHALTLALSQRERGPNANPQSLIPNPFFAVRTPTASVVDLGTEFGVEVLANGETVTQVFEGKVRLIGLGQADQLFERTMTAGEAMRFSMASGIVDISKDNSKQFVREMPRPKSLPQPMPSPELIGNVDYSETWSANSPTRAGSYMLLNTPESLWIENCHGNAPRSWAFSAEPAMTTCPFDNSPVPWPGYQAPGSKDGFVECGYGTCYFGFEYGLRDDFVVQFDAVQPEDRINITIGDRPATIGDQPEELKKPMPLLSVFFRAPGTPYPEIGIYTPAKGEVETGIRSGISKPYQWHNYAVRINLREKRFGVWVDRQYRGAIDLTAITQGMEKGSKRSWADLSWTKQFVTVGAAGSSRVWSDNFRIGSPREIAWPTTEKPSAATSSLQQEKGGSK